MINHVMCLTLLLLAGCGGGNELGGEPGNDLPAALSRFEGGHEVTPFVNYSVEGLTLYRVAVVGVADLDRVSVVGVSAEGGQLVSGAELFVQMRGSLTADELAGRALDTLLGSQAGQPLTPDTEGTRFSSEAEWALVQAPSIEAGVLTFFELRGSMAPAVVRHRVTLATGVIETTTVRELATAASEESVSCEPIAACGCWVGCAQVVPEGDHFRVVDGAHADQVMRRRPECTNLRGARSCMRVCDADGPDAPCRDALVRENEECTEACPPTEAPFHCEPSSSGCFRVAHPRRIAARDR